MKNYIFLLVVAVVIFSCNNKKASKNSKDKIVQQENENIAYSSNYVVQYGLDTLQSKNILFVVIDPHGDGKLAVSQFSKVLEKYNITIVGLTDVENNQQDFLQRINADIAGAEHNLNISPKYIFIGGFSGGARMALAYAQANNVNGLLMCGAGASKNQIPNLPISMIIGTKDFNFIEQYYSPFSDLVWSENLLTIVFEGRHEWPPQDDIFSAVSFLLAKNNIQIADLDVADLLENNDKFLSNKQYFLAFKSLETAYKIASSTEKENVKQKINSLLQQPDFKDYMNMFELVLSEEYERNQTYLKLLEPKDLNWWQSEIAKIDKLSNSDDKLQADSYARTRAYLGIAMYSYCSREIQNPNSQMIDKLLAIYKVLEPDNDDLKRFETMRKNQLN